MNWRTLSLTCGTHKAATASACATATMRRFGPERFFARLMPQVVRREERRNRAANSSHCEKCSFGHTPHPISSAILVPGKHEVRGCVYRQDIQSDPRQQGTLQDAIELPAHNWRKTNPNEKAREVPI